MRDARSDAQEVVDELLGVRELAEMYKVPERTIYAWFHAGTGPKSYRIGKYRRVKRSDALAWLEARAVEQRSA